MSKWCIIFQCAVMYNISHNCDNLEYVASFLHVCTWTQSVLRLYGQGQINFSFETWEVSHQYRNQVLSCESKKISYICN